MGKDKLGELAQETHLVGSLISTGADFHHGMIIRSRLGEPAGDGPMARPSHRFVRAKVRSINGPKTRIRALPTSL